MQDVSTVSSAVPLGDSDEHDVPVTFPSRECYLTRLRSQVLSQAPPLQQVVTVDEKPLDIVQRPVAAQYGEAHVTTIYEKEQPLLPYLRTYTLDIPVPLWMSAVQPTSAVLEFTLTVPTEEIDQATANLPNDWTLSVNTRSLFTSALPWASAFIVGAGGRPHAWTLALAGFLADAAVRPKLLSVSLGFKTRELANVSLDVMSRTGFQAVSGELLPPAAGPGEEDRDEEAEFVLL